MDQIEPQQPVKKPRKTPSKKTYLSAREAALVVELGLKDTPQRAIAKAVGCNAATVSRYLKKFKKAFKHIDKIDEYREVKSQIIDSVAFETLKTMNNPSKLKKATFNNLAYGFDILNKASRLERNLSTANISSAIQFTGVIPQSE